MIYYCKIKSPVVFNSPGWIVFGGGRGVNFHGILVPLILSNDVRFN